MTKITKGQMKIYEGKLRELNKERKQKHQPKLSMSEYLDLVIPKKYKKPEFEEWSPEPTLQSERSSEHKQYPSCHSSPSTAARADAKKESPQYTGTLIKGIATMHKSNAVPVMDSKQAEEIARMAK